MYRLMSANVSEAHKSVVSRDQSNTFTWETNQRWKYERSRLQWQGDNPKRICQKEERREAEASRGNQYGGINAKLLC
jgi:hypothetical protein